MNPLRKRPRRLGYLRIGGIGWLGILMVIQLLFFYTNDLPERCARHRLKILGSKRKHDMSEMGVREQFSLI